jgi:fluoride exporter
MMHVLLVGLGGFIGSILRYGLTGLTQRWTDSEFPFGTLAVNLVGCFLIGILWSLVEYRQWLHPELRIFLTVGILGGFTTFSAFGYETFVLIRDGQYPWALANVAANVIFGIAAVIVGWTLAKAVGGIS